MEIIECDYFEYKPNIKEYFFSVEFEDQNFENENFEIRYFLWLN